MNQNLIDNYNRYKANGMRDLYKRKISNLIIIYRF